MDFGGEARFSGWSMGGGGMVVPDLDSNWNPSVNDQAIWATEDEYRNWNSGPLGENSSNSNSAPTTKSGNEPASKKSRNSQSGGDSSSVNSSNRSKAIGKMFFKTKLCCKFRVGVCPYITNCNFAHGLEELRRPPPNWQEIVAAHEEERGVSGEQREEHQIPTITTSDTRGETQRSYKGRHCKKFYTEEGCPYGDTCTFLHDEQSRSRESVAISVSPTVGGGGVGGGASGVAGGGSYAIAVTGSNQKPSNWKTRICNKWETTGNCPFGSKCHFAHGLAELHKYGGGLVDTETRDSTVSTENVVVAAKTTEIIVASSNFPLAPRPDFHHTGIGGVPSQRLSNMLIQQPGLGYRAIQKWKGPDKISKIYGDWIDDIE